MKDEVWVLGATGRSGRATAARLHEAGVALVLVGRDRGRLEVVAGQLGSAPRLLVGSLSETLAQLAADPPGVVVNTVGPFTTTAAQVASACPPGTSYVDIANELSAVEQILALDAEAQAKDQVLVTGAGYGVLGTESVVLRLCADRPRPTTVRVDALPSIDLDADVVGSALAGSIVEILTFGGREVRNGRLVRSANGAHPKSLTTPNGEVLRTGAGANGELLAAWRASGADSVVAASTAAPSNVLVRTALPVLAAVIRIPGVAGLATSRIARIPLRASVKPRPSSWSHARVEWSDGTVREGWLRVGDGSGYTSAVTAEVTRRILAGKGKPGAYTPGALFGPELAGATGGEFVLDSPPPASGPTMPTNSAAWLGAKHARLEVRPAPYTSPGPNEVVVRNHAVAVNPVDWAKQAMDNFLFPWIRYPFVLGYDLAGEVVEVGSAVTRFQVGDRVLALAVGAEKKRNRAAEGAFQAFTVVLDHLAAPIPDTLSYADAAVLPLGLSTAACGLFQTDQLALHHPSAAPTPTGKTLLVWGGSTSVGSNAIQLAAAAGYEVVTTCSPHNADYVRRLGASEVFDYRSPTVVADLVRALQGKTIAGALAIGTGSSKSCLEVVAACRGDRVVSLASQPVALDELAERPGANLDFARLAGRMVAGNVSVALRARRQHVRTKAVLGTTLMDNEVGGLIYEQFLPAALAEGRYVCAPAPVVIGHGLDSVQPAFDAQRSGVSARKVVVTL